MSQAPENRLLSLVVSIFQPVCARVSTQSIYTCGVAQTEPAVTDAEHMNSNNNDELAKMVDAERYLTSTG